MKGYEALLLKTNLGQGCKRDGTCPVPSRFLFQFVSLSRRSGGRYCIRYVIFFISHGSGEQTLHWYFFCQLFFLNSGNRKSKLKGEIERRNRKVKIFEIRFRVTSFDFDFELLVLISIFYFRVLVDSNF